MSTPPRPPDEPPGEDPTRIQSTVPAPAEVVEERVVYEDAVATESEVRSLRRWVAVAGIWAVAASVIAIIALLDTSDDSEKAADRNRVTNEQRDLSQRVDTLSAQQRRLAEETDIEALEKRLGRSGEETDVKRLEQRLRRVEGDIVDAVEGASDAGQSADELDERIDGLSDQVQRLRRQQREEPAP